MCHCKAGSLTRVQHELLADVKLELQDVRSVNS
jgi:hypothetical protein